MELFFWQALAILATFVAGLAMLLVGVIAFADQATYRRGR